VETPRFDPAQPSRLFGTPGVKPGKCFDVALLQRSDFERDPKSAPSVKKLSLRQSVLTLVSRLNRRINKIEKIHQREKSSDRSIRKSSPRILILGPTGAS
jgi:hypothetical protein